MEWRKIFLVVALAGLVAGAGAQDVGADPRGATLITSCQTLSVPGSYILGKSLTAVGTCLVIAADFVTLDLDGQVVTGNGTGLGITDNSSARQGLAVRNGTVTGFLTGIE